MTRAAQVLEGVRVRDVDGHVEVFGLDQEQVRLALELLAAVGDSQVRERSQFRARLNQAMLETATPLLPEATQRQALRRAATRERLMTSQGYDTNDTLATKRGMGVNAVRTWISRERDRHRLFTVKLGNRTFIPSVQLTADGRLNDAVTPLVRILLEAHLDGWSLWSWLCSPSGLLSGDVPAEVAEVNGERAERAATRMAAELELARTDTA